MPKKEDERVPIPTASGELGELIEEAEADFITKWLDVIERKANNETKPLNKNQREEILKRDGYHCTVPHCKTPAYKLQVHHLVWRGDFGGQNIAENLATICLNHHIEAHPGLGQAFNDYRGGDKQSFKRYIEQNNRWKYQPTPRVMDVVAGIIYQRTQSTDKKI